MVKFNVDDGIFFKSQAELESSSSKKGLLPQEHSNAFSAGVQHGRFSSVPSFTFVIGTFGVLLAAVGVCGCYPTQFDDGAHPDVEGGSCDVFCVGRFFGNVTDIRKEMVYGQLPTDVTNNALVAIAECAKAETYVPKSYLNPARLLRLRLRIYCGLLSNNWLHDT